MGFYRGAEDVKCHQLVKSNRKNHTVASETEDLAFFTMVGMVGLLGGFPSLVSWFFCRFSCCFPVGKSDELVPFHDISMVQSTRKRETTSWLVMVNVA